MHEPNTRPYTASVIYDLPTRKEVNRYIRYQRHAFSFILLFVIIYLVYVFGANLLLQQSISSETLLMFGTIFIAGHLIVRLLQRNGGNDYKRMLSHNGGKPTCVEYSFLTEGIQWHNPYTGGSQIIPYGQIQAIFETPNYLVIRLEHNIFEAIAKHSICGGPESTFIQKLLEASPNIKKKKLQSSLPGKLIERFFAVFVILLLVLGIVFSAPVQQILHNTGSINADMSFTEITQELEALGIHDIPQDVLDDVAQWEQSYETNIPQNGIYKCTNLLCMTGMGTYDEETWQWTPAQTGVFWFDVEAFDLSRMYTNLLLGVQGLDPEALCFTDILEDCSGVNWEQGTGTQSVSFTFSGESHTISANVMYDWYDLNFLNKLNKIIEAETGKSLYFAWDHGQGYLVFYGDNQWAQRFQVATGIHLSKNINLLNTLY